MILDDKVLEGLGSKTLVELREIAKELKIKSITTYKKNELIEIINSKSKNEEKVNEETKEKNEDIKEDIKNRKENIERESIEKEVEYKSPTKSYNKKEIDTQNISQNQEHRNQRNDYNRPNVFIKSSKYSLSISLLSSSAGSNMFSFTFKTGIKL